ncbi:MAG: hypothetical protein GDA49_11375 [Rhodospirillales bacterium]|nr:hypothetical protein [Rhodospirillales bacterium]
MACWIWLRRKTVRGVLIGLAGSSASDCPNRTEQSTLWLSGGTFAIWSGQYIAFMTWLPQYMVEDFAVDPAANALCVVAVLVSALITGRLLRGGHPTRHAAHDNHDRAGPQRPRRGSPWALESLETLPPPNQLVS